MRFTWKRAGRLAEIRSETCSDLSSAERALAASALSLPNLTVNSHSQSRKLTTLLYTSVLNSFGGGAMYELGL